MILCSWAVLGIHSVALYEKSWKKSCPPSEFGPVAVLPLVCCMGKAVTASLGVGGEITSDLLDFFLSLFFGRPIPLRGLKVQIRPVVRQLRHAPDVADGQRIFRVWHSSQASRGGASCDLELDMKVRVGQRTHREWVTLHGLKEETHAADKAV